MQEHIREKIKKNHSPFKKLLLTLKTVAIFSPPKVKNSTGLITGKL
jgi:hypothetical protein